MLASTATLPRQEIQEALAAHAAQLKKSRKTTSKLASQLSWLIMLAVLATASVFVARNFKPAAHAMVLQEAQRPLRQVALASPELSSAAQELILPAEVHAWQSTPINARIAGYLKSWRADRGTRVKAGEVLAEIDAPEFDQELIRAQSDLEEGRAKLMQVQAERDEAVANLNAARANVFKGDATLDLAEKNEVRFRDLEEQRAASRQQYDEALRNREVARADLVAIKAAVASSEAAVATREAAIRTAQARVHSLEAGLRRLKELEIFKTIVAPYDGTITQRNVDAGALVSTDSTRPLFTIVQDQTLRVTANVPQTYAAVVKTGQEAAVLAREFSKDGLPARVARTSGAIDPAARTLAVELELPNENQRVLPGAFVQIKFKLQEVQPVVRVPARTLRFSKDGAQVFSLNSENRLELHTLKLGRDFGTSVEALEGLNGDEKLVVNPSDDMASGEQVRTDGGEPAKMAAAR